MSDLVSMNVVVSRQAREKLDKIMHKLKLTNIHVAVEKSIEIAFEKMETS